MCLCVLQLDPEAYIDTCLYLYCSLPTKERDSAVCDTLASYARECAQQHVIIIWRTATLCGKKMSKHINMSQSLLYKTVSRTHDAKIYKTTSFNSLLCLSRSCLSQRSGVFRLCVLLSPQLCVSPAPRACSHGSVQRGVCGGL